MRKIRYDYSVPDKVLDKLVNLLRSWSLTENDWFLATECALERFGYYLVNKQNLHEIDIGIRRRALPWPINKEEWTCLPPVGSKWFKQYTNFVSKTGHPFHLVAVPFGPLGIQEITKSSRYFLPSGRWIHVNHPELYVRQRSNLLLHPKTSLNFQEKVPRWASEIKCLHSLARARNDSSLIKVCKEFFTIIKGIKTVKKVIRSREGIQGMAIGRGIIRGCVHVIQRKAEFALFRRGEILVTEDARIDFLPIMMKAIAVITDHGGRVAHAATLARELQIPCIIGTRVATKILKTGDQVEIDLDEGTVRKVKK